MGFKFQEGERVALRREYADLLPAGSVGVVFCIYDTDPPAYEVTFRATDGSDYGTIAAEADLKPLTSSVPAAQPQVTGAAA